MQLIERHIIIDNKEIKCYLIIMNKILTFKCNKKNKNNETNNA